MSEYHLGAGGYVGLSLPQVWFAKLPSQIEVQGHSLVKKNEFHVSLVCLFKRAPMYGTPVGEEEDVKRLHELFNEYVSEYPITFTRFIPDLRFAEKEDRKSLVIRCEVAGLEGLFTRIEETLGRPIERQPTHVTIYALTPDGGIGINTKTDMEQLPQIMLPEILSALGLA